ncbi:MAG: hypothetical protein WD355_09965 [Balneolaceae bacterium]
MQKQHEYRESEIDDLILKFADESFTFRDAVSFQSLTSERIELIDIALINKEIRHKLNNLPKIKAAPGFEAKLAARLQEEEY